jgi:hypothetical protein
MSSFWKELIKRNRKSLGTGEFENVCSLLIEKFPENVFLDEFNLYKTETMAKSWENFDPLFFGLMDDPEFNDLSYDVLVDSFLTGKIDKKNLDSLIYYLNWNRNDSLSIDLIKWGETEGILNEEQYNFLMEDLTSRQAEIQEQSKTVGAGPVELLSSIKKLMELKGLNINLGRNLICDGGLDKKASLHMYWTFSDMSDKEPFSKGSFIGDIDEYEKNSIRVMGFYTEKTENRHDARGGFWYKSNIPLDRKYYLFHFKYMTLEESESPSFWLTDELGKEPRLQPTQKVWKECFYLFNNSTLNLTIVKPLLRMWGVGTVWFEDIGLFELAAEGDFLENDLLIIQ